MYALRGFREIPCWRSTCVLVCHSQGGYLGSHAAAENPECIRGVVCAEGSSWLADERIPTAAVVGSWLVPLGIS